MSELSTDHGRRWHGMAGHFCDAGNCRYHLCTEIPGYLISTIGGYLLPGDKEYREIGYLRKYETFVFRLEPGYMRCECGCEVPHPQSYCEIDMLPANDPSEAEKNHYIMLEKYERKEK